MLTDKQIGFAMRKAFEKGADDNDLTMLMAILLNMDEDYCGKSNEQLARYLKDTGRKGSERSITDWVAALKDKNIIGVIQNRHAHRRQIYIRGINKERKFAYEPALEDMTEAQRKFKRAFPDRKVDCDVPDDVDIDLVIEIAKKSNYIQTVATGMTLYSFCYRHYDNLIQGRLGGMELKKDTDANFTQRTYTKEQCNSLFQKVEEIEV